jgi:ATP-dependent DNA ligase
MKLEPTLLDETYDTSVLGDATKIFEEKYNGVRAIVHVKNGCIVGIRGRSDAPMLFMFPELRGLKVCEGDAILDGEICIIRDGKSIFYGGIDGRRAEPSKSEVAENPVTLIVFDTLFLGEQLITSPYEKRYALLKDKLICSDRVKLIENWTDGKALWEKVKQENREGIVIRNPKAPYEMGRCKSVVKLKNYKVADILVEKVENNSKGQKVYGTAIVGDKTIQAEVQLGGVFDVKEHSAVTIKYLDLIGTRFIQPTKVSNEQKEAIQCKEKSI